MPAAMPIQQTETTYMLMDSKSAMTDDIRSNPVYLTKQSDVKDGGEEKGSGCSGDNYRKEGNNGCKRMMVEMAAVVSVQYH